MKYPQRSLFPPRFDLAARLFLPLLLTAALFNAALRAADPAQQAAVPAVQAPAATAVKASIHVLEGDSFAADLGPADIEVRVDGVLVPVESLALVRNGAVERREPAEAAAPDVSRRFYILCQTVDWDPALGGVVNHLFEDVLRPGDSLTLLTPLKVYTLSSEALARKPKASLSREMQGILRKDIQTTGGDYRSLVRNLRRLVGEIGGTGRPFGEDMESDSTTSMFGLETRIESYKQALIKLESIRILDERKVLAFADALRREPGRKVVFLFYQREFRPEISPGVLNQMMSMYQDQPNILSDLTDLFQFYRREVQVNTGRVSAAFADAGALFHLFFMNKEAESVFGANMREQSEDVFPVFRQAAEATGGLVDTSQNPGAGFRRAAAQANDYYVIEFTPPPAAAGSFQKLEITVKGREAEVAHASGFYAR